MPKNNDENYKAVETLLTKEQASIDQHQNMNPETREAANRDRNSAEGRLLPRRAPDDLETPPKRFEPPEGGWGWVVCLASFWTNGTLFGVLNTFGILYVKMLKEFGGNRKDIAFKTSWVGSLCVALTFSMGPVASILMNRVGIRPTAFIGAIIATSGMLASSFVSSLELLYFTYGVMIGIGAALVYTPSMVILGHWFDRRLGMVNGIVACGSAVSTIVLPFVLRPCLADIGLRNTMRALSGMLAVLILCSLTWKPLLTHQQQPHQSTSSKKDKGQCCHRIQSSLNLDVWRNKSYRVWVISVAIAMLGYFIPLAHLVKHTRDILPDARGELLVTCIGATSGIGRLIFGKLADHIDQIGLNRINMQQVAYAIYGVTTACIPFAESFGALIGVTLVMGLCDGCLVCMLGPITFDLLGPRGGGHGFGFLMGLMSIPMMTGPPVAGLVYDKLHTYTLAFIGAGIPALSGAILMFFAFPLTRAKPEVEEIEMNGI